MCYTGYALATPVDPGKKPYRFLKLRCNRWSCPDCALFLRANLINRVIISFKNVQPRFGTLTFNQHGRSIENVFRSIPRDWAKMLRWLKANYFIDRYFRVIEQHKSGFPHLHFVIDRYVDVHDLSRYWSHIGAGRIVDIRSGPIEVFAGYLSKYLTKQFKENSNGKDIYRLTGNKRYTFSKSCPPLGKSNAWKISYAGQSRKEAYERFLRLAEYFEQRGCPVRINENNLEEFWIA
jgi:hypothetical protein